MLLYTSNRKTFITKTQYTHMGPAPIPGHSSSVRGSKEFTDNDLKVAVESLLKPRLKGEEAMSEENILTTFYEMVRENFGGATCDLVIDTDHCECGMYMRMGMGKIKNISTGNDISFRF